MQKSLPAREEYKYYIPRSLYPHLMDDLRPFTEADTNAKSEGFYRVTSVYFENRSMTSYRDKIEGQARRVKLRLRYYPLDPASGLNVELKYKLLDKCLKRKLKINQDLGARMLRDEFLETGEAENEPLLMDFLRFKKVSHFLPFIRIDYKRKALVGKNDKKVRVTFDHDVKCGRVSKNSLQEPYIPALPRGTVILEIKTPGYFPFWLTHIIKKYSLSRSSISKYTLSVQNLAVNSALQVK